MFEDLSLTSWWPLRACLLVATVLAALVLVWRGRKWWSRAALVLGLVVLLPLNALLGVNAYYGYYLTLGQAVGPATSDNPAVLNQHKRPPTGQVVSVAIPGRYSRFKARRAEVYLPPAWFAARRPRLPVLVLLHGTPGSPVDWLDGGQAATTLDGWAANHHGRAPVVVIPDVNGGLTRDTECVNSPRGNAETYLTKDLPDYVRQRFFTRPPGRAWAVAGLSEGGMCAMMLSLRHPGLFSTFGDFEGLAGPRIGHTNTLGATVRTLFAGRRSRFMAHEPSWLLTHRHYTGLSGWFETGDQDRVPSGTARRLAGMAHRAGIATRLVVVPGDGHTFGLWRLALSDSLPWLVRHVDAPAPRPQRK